MACDLCNLLAAPDSALIWADDRVSVVAVDEPEYPGFTRVVWNAHVKEMTDLPAEDRVHIMNVVWAVESAQRQVFAPEKINLASFGNMTPHVHWHVIPRYRDDAHFPNPTWAVAERASPAEVLAARRALLPALHAAIVEKVKAS
ncbi:HIT domain-containing protein [Duganella sp. FT109W]|uniref:HIT domain-containing protein n=1 Tax=Duganella margarita TaxID=2692170 RepID=A0ABW9WJW6_9BURK|nr:HIT family protein [Duganella margarita]MYN40638.1 HIT domain-containing protein [Duganella margarita]